MYFMFSMMVSSSAYKLCLSTQGVEADLASRKALTVILTCSLSLAVIIP